MNPWDGVVTDEEMEIYRAAGLGKSSGMGNRPVLLIIDVQYRTVGTKPAPFWEAVKEFPTACGPGRLGCGPQHREGPGPVSGARLAGPLSLRVLLGAAI